MQSGPPPAAAQGWGRPVKAGSQGQPARDGTAGDGGRCWRALLPGSAKAPGCWASSWPEGAQGRGTVIQAVERTAAVRPARPRHGGAAAHTSPVERSGPDPMCAQFQPKTSQPPKPIEERRTSGRRSSAAARAVMSPHIKYLWRGKGREWAAAPSAGCHMCSGSRKDARQRQLFAKRPRQAAPLCTPCHTSTHSKQGSW